VEEYHGHLQIELRGVRDARFARSFVASARSASSTRSPSVLMEGTTLK